VTSRKRLLLVAHLAIATFIKYVLSYLQCSNNGGRTSIFAPLICSLVLQITSYQFTITDSCYYQVYACTMHGWVAYIRPFHSLITSGGRKRTWKLINCLITRH